MSYSCNLYYLQQHQSCRHKIIKQKIKTCWGNDHHNNQRKFICWSIQELHVQGYGVKALGPLVIQRQQREEWHVMMFSSHLPLHASHRETR